MKPLSFPCIAVAAGLAFTAGHAAAASPLAPVRPGLWHLEAHAAFNPDPEPGGRSWPFLPGKPRDRDETICLSESRAREPMPLPSGQGNEAVLVAPDTLASRSTTPDAPGGAGTAEWRYRRIDATAFEGRWVLASPGLRMSLDYQARFVAPDCGQVAPSNASKFGEP